MRDRHRQPHDRPRSSRPPRDRDHRPQRSGRSTDRGTPRQHPDGGGSNGQPPATRHPDRDENARGSGRQRQRSGHTGRLPQRAHGGRAQTPHYRSQGNPRIGSQRGEDSVQGVSGRAGAHFGDLHHSRQSGDRTEGAHAEDQFAGGAGRSARDRRFGSRRGHGSQRRENPRTRSGGGGTGRR